jgi:hypothetical protein
LSPLGKSGNNESWGAQPAKSMQPKIEETMLAIFRLAHLAEKTEGGSLK